MTIIKTAISVQESLLERVESLAQEASVPRNHIVALALEEFLKRQENRKLLESINAAHEEILEQAQEAESREMLRRYHRKMVEGQ